MYGEHGDHSNDGILKEVTNFFRDMMGLQDKYEVFFYDNIHNENSKTSLKKTGYVISKDMVTDTKTWLKHSKLSEQINARAIQETGMAQLINPLYNQFSIQELMREIKSEIKKEDPASFGYPATSSNGSIRPLNFPRHIFPSNETGTENKPLTSQASPFHKSATANFDSNPQIQTPASLSMVQVISQEVQDLKSLPS